MQFRRARTGHKNPPRPEIRKKYEQITKSPALGWAPKIRKSYRKNTKMVIFGLFLYFFGNFFDFWECLNGGSQTGAYTLNLQRVTRRILPGRSGLSMGLIGTFSGPILHLCGAPRDRALCTSQLQGDSSCCPERALFGPMLPVGPSPWPLDLPETSGAPKIPQAHKDEILISSATEEE